MQRAFGGERREFAIVSDASPGPVVGRIAAKGLADELHDRPYLVIDGLDGRGHYVTLPKATTWRTFRSAESWKYVPDVESAADRNIAAMAKERRYLRASTFETLRSRGLSRGEPKKSWWATCGVWRPCAVRASSSASRTGSGECPPTCLTEARPTTAPGG